MLCPGFGPLQHNWNGTLSKLEHCIKAESLLGELSPPGTSHIIWLPLLGKRCSWAFRESRPLVSPDQIPDLGHHSLQGLAAARLMDASM